MKRRTYLFIALMAVCLMTSCIKRKSLETLSGEWNVVSVGELAIPDTVEAFMVFDVSEELFYGCAGCNQLIGNLATNWKSETPMFEAIGGTRKLCADMRIENAVLSMLELAVDFNVEGDMLSFFDASGATIMSLSRR